MSFIKSILERFNGIPKVSHFWVAIIAVVVTVLASMLGTPGDLAKSERLDPILGAEELISRRQFAGALNALSGLSFQGLDDWEAKRVLLQRAICLQELGRYGEALAGFQAVKPDESPVPDYLAYWIGECFEGLGKADSATAYFAQVVDTEPMSLLRDGAALQAADLAMTAGQPEEAAEHFEALLGRSEREVSALSGLIEALQAQGDSIGVRSMRIRLVRDYPSRSVSMVALRALEPLESPAEKFYAGVAYAENKQFTNATRLFKQLVSGPEEIQWTGRAQYELGHVYYRTRKYVTAEPAFRKAHTVFRIPKALMDLGRCSVRRGRDLEAADRFQEFARIYPNVTGASESLWQAAMAYERRGKHADARKVFLELTRRYPRSEYADQGGWRAGYSLYQMEDYEGSARAFLRLAQHTSENYLRDQGYYWAGKCYEKLGKEEEAGYWVERAAEGFPTSYYSSRARAVLGLTSEVYPEASSDDNANSGAYKDSPNLVKGDYLAALGRYRQAEREYDRVQRLHRNDLFALDAVLQRFEHIRSMNRALRVSNQIVSAERRQGIPMTLASFRRLYPIYYWGEVNRTAHELDLDPNLILAIMRQESAFDEGALSRVGARGLMQVMPTTGTEMAQKEKLRPFSPDDLWNPQVSIRLGGRHLLDHLNSFDSKDDRRLGLALSAYNAGLTAARRWSRRLKDRDVDEFVESIPYKETRNYVKLVYRNYQVYSYLQGEEPALFPRSAN